MKRKVMTLVKACKPLYSLYYYIGSLIINILKIFIKTEDNIILFVSFGGKKFDDSPRTIYEKMINDSRFDKYTFIWAFNQPEKIEIPRGRKIKIDTFEYYVIALKARCWITNSTIERGLNFKGKNTFYFNTWHGTPIKKMGSDIDSSNKSFKSKTKEWKVDKMTAQGNFEADIFSRVFNIYREKFIPIGLPRNDVLYNYTEDMKEELLKKLGINKNKKIILYAPTFREYDRDIQMNCISDIPIDFSKWKNSLGNEYLILFRAHYEVAKTLDIDNYKDFIIDVSRYPVLNDLMIVSDILISDYSSIFFDYSILNKPMISFTYDYEKYSKNRGMYFDIREQLLGGSMSEDELIDIIQNLPIEECLEKVKLFREKYVEFYGNATEKSLDIIIENISKE